MESNSDPIWVVQEQADFDAFCNHLGTLVSLHDHTAIDAAIRHGRSTFSKPEHIAVLADYYRILESYMPATAGLPKTTSNLNVPPDIFIQLARELMPGPSYYDHLDYLHRVLRPSTYLEIGIDTGATLQLARPDTNVVGVDPSPRLRQRLPLNTKIYDVTSNEFFEKLAPTVLSQLAPISLAFIDGLHVFEQALLDFIHIEAHCDPGAVVVFHDTLPVSELSASRVRRTRYWCGDVWKIVACLEYFRPDLQIVTLPIFPSGLTIVSHLDPSSNILRLLFDRAIKQFADQPFSVCEEHLARVRATVTNSFFSMDRAINSDNEPNERC